MACLTYELLNRAGIDYTLRLVDDERFSDL